MDAFSGENLDEEKHDESEQDEHDGVFSGTHVLLVLIDCVHQIDAKGRLVGIAEFVVRPIIGDRAIEAQHVPRCLESVLVNFIFRGEISGESGRLPRSAHLHGGGFANRDKVDVAAPFQFQLIIKSYGFLKCGILQSGQVDFQTVFLLVFGARFGTVFCSTQHKLPVLANSPQIGDSQRNVSSAHIQGHPFGVQFFGEGKTPGETRVAFVQDRLVDPIVPLFGKQLRGDFQSVGGDPQHALLDLHRASFRRFSCVWDVQDGSVQCLRTAPLVIDLADSFFACLLSFADQALNHNARDQQHEGHKGNNDRPESERLREFFFRICFHTDFNFTDDVFKRTLNYKVKLQKKLSNQFFKGIEMLLKAFTAEIGKRIFCVGFSSDKLLGRKDVLTRFQGF